MSALPGPHLNIAVIGSGIAGLSAAWLLSKRHRVTIFEAGASLGGHSCTVDVADPLGSFPVDMGFIVYNEPAYPNLCALFDYFGIPTVETDMSLAITLDGGTREYSGDGLGGIFAQKSNLLRPRFWRMLYDLIRFYRGAPSMVEAIDAKVTLGELLDRNGFSDAFRHDHLLPMAGAIWSANERRLAEFPARSFVRFYVNHGLLALSNRKPWRTVKGGSRSYVRAIEQDFNGTIRRDTRVLSVRRDPSGVEIVSQGRPPERFDQVVLASHTDETLAMLADATAQERALLGAIPYQQNTVVLHEDASFMPRRRRVWSSWNHAAADDANPEVPVRVTYWMNRLQHLPTPRNLFVTLNPERPVAPEHLLQSRQFSHPVFSAEAMAAQAGLDRIQGQNRAWFCGAWAGWGFHEDGLQSGLGVAEALGGVLRPWTVAEASGRVRVSPVAGVL